VVSELPDETYTKREFLLMRAIQRGANWDAAQAAVDRAIQNNPGWESDERKPYREWANGPRDF
jgi:hypothetical protein